MRARYWARAVPPPGLGVGRGASSGTENEDEPHAFVCTVNERGDVCDAGFQTFRALRTHMRFHHGIR
eukprot:7089988-Heterocapsa_arctica.AAC.1